MESPCAIGLHDQGKQSEVCITIAVNGRRSLSEFGELLDGISEIVRLIRQHGNAQAKRTVDAGGSANTTTVSRARAVYVGGLPAKQMTEQKPSLAVSLMPSNTELRGERNERSE